MGLTTSHWTQGKHTLTENPMKMYEDFVERMRTYKETKIPRIIHQIWFSNKKVEKSTMPARYERMSKKLQEFYPGVKHIWWGREEVLELWKIPELEKYRPVFDSMKHPVIRADIGRILISYAHGGFYVDLDSAPNPDFTEDELFKDIPGGLRLFHDYYTMLTYL